MKRFYISVEASETPSGFEILLDGKSVKTPKRRTLLIPTQALAYAVRDEWRAQQETIDKRSMLLTTLCNIALDVIPDDHEIILNDLLSYAETDLLCYRADEEKLAALQTKRFDAILSWVKKRFQVELRLTVGVMPVEQPAENLEIFRAHLSSLDDFSLAAISHATRITGSLFLSLALCEQELNDEQVFLAARLDELYQAEAWGKTEAFEQKQDAIRKEARILEQFFVSLQETTCQDEK
jgi:chaperone required for assembly of F1-ATPase